MEGFARLLEVSAEWPAEGARAVWESTPGGRGRVTEKVIEHRPGRFVTQVFEEAMAARQALSVEPAGEGTRLELELRYDLTRQGPLRAVADVLFIRRALRDALARTLRRFAAEAEEAVRLR